MIILMRGSYSSKLGAATALLEEFLATMVEIHITRRAVLPVGYYQRFNSCEF